MLFLLPSLTLCHLGNKGRGFHTEISKSLNRLSVSTYFPSLDWSWSWLVSISKYMVFSCLAEYHSQYLSNFPVSISLGLDIQEISQSRFVLVSTSKKSISLDESRSRPPINFTVLISLDLTFHEISKSCWAIKQRKLNKRNLTKLDTFNQNHFIYWTKFAFTASYSEFWWLG